MSKLFSPPISDVSPLPPAPGFIPRRKVMQYDEVLAAANRLFSVLILEINRHDQRIPFLNGVGQATSLLSRGAYGDRVAKLEKLLAPLMNASDAPPTQTADSTIVP